VATLEQDLYDAFAKATLGDQTEQGKTVGEQTGDAGNIKELSKDVATSIIDWMLKQTFTITEMKATTELESFETRAPGAIQIMPGIPTAGSPAAQVTTAPGNSSPINLSKGIMATFGHTYVGRPAMKVLNADTADEWNDYTKVKLDPYKLKDYGTQQYPVSDREAEEEEEAVELKPPEAKFVKDQEFGLWVELDDISIPGDGLLDSSNNVWDTGDGTITTGVAPLQYTFECGEPTCDYDVSLTVTDTNDLSHTYEETITVTDFVPPVASFTTTINDNFVFFNNASTAGDGTIMSWYWEFGDGGTSENPYPTHEFVAGQTYSVSLTVTDQYDKIDTYTEDITIEGEE
jgi:hypothetical protein